MNCSRRCIALNRRQAPTLGRRAEESWTADGGWGHETGEGAKHQTRIGTGGPELRGRGIADEIVRVALDDALEQGYKVIPACWFVRVYMDRHPAKYQQLRAG